MKRNSDGSVFTVPQLARALSNMPGFLTNGNTPTGVFSVKELGVSSNVFIGPTPNIQLLLPFEGSRAEFLMRADELGNEIKKEEYAALFPASWQQSEYIYMSWYAGKAGRSEIIAHGTTVNPAYYKNEEFFPFTPTLGCLCTLEFWNTETGLLERSGQYELTENLTSATINGGLYYVLEIPENFDVKTIQEIIEKTGL